MKLQESQCEWRLNKLLQPGHIMVQGYPATRSGPAVTKVRKVTRRRNLRSVSLVSVMLILFGLSLLSVFLRCQIAVTGYKIVHLKQEVADLDKETKRLELRIAELSSPARVETVAVTRLGMCKPDKIQTIAFKEEASSVASAASRIEDAQGLSEKQEKPMEKLYRVIVRLGSTASKSTLGMMD